MYYMGSIRLARNTYLHLKQLNLIFSAFDNEISIYLQHFSSIDFSVPNHLGYHVQKCTKKMSLNIIKSL